MTFFIILFIFCLALAAFFSGSEMAFVSSNRLSMRSLAESGNSSARKILRLQENPQHFLSAVLIGNNVVHVAATAALAYLFELYFGWKSEWLVTAVMAPLLIIFCEMVPKDYCRIRSEAFLLRYADSLALISLLLHLPVTMVLSGIHLILKPFKSILDKNIFVSEKEFRMLIEEGARSGALEDHEKQLIETIIDFERVHLTSVMIPLNRVEKVDISATVGVVKALARRTQTRMVIVYEEIPSIVVGMIYVFDLLFEEDDSKSLKDYLRSPIFISGSSSVEKAFLALQQKRQSYAVVIDENAEAVGVAPIERLIEF